MIGLTVCNNQSNIPRITLLKHGVNLDLSNIIEAFSSCPCFILRFKKRYDLHKPLLTLDMHNLLYELIQIVNTNSIPDLDIFKSETFENLIIGEHQEPFDLAMDIINKVYDEIKQLKYYAKNDDWLIERLPMRIIMTYVISCDCGYNALSPFQSEISITVTTSRTSRSLQSLIDTYFGDALIDGRVCEDKGCKEERGKQTRKLSLPLPETLCIHIAVNDGRHKMRQPLELIIKKDYCVLVPEEDIIYSLRSVILAGNKGCYKRTVEGWYLIRGETQTMVEESTIIVCDPDILLYELIDLGIIEHNLEGDNSLEIPLPLINYCTNNDVNTVIHALSSCQNFVNWIKNMDITDGMNRTRTILRLLSLTQANVNEDGVIGLDDIKNLLNHNCTGTYQVVRQLFSGMINEIRSSMNSDGETLIERTPWTFTSSCVLTCNCGAKILVDTEDKVVMNLSVDEDVPTNLQDLIEAYFQEVFAANEKCRNQSCSENCVSRRIILHHPLPRMLCVHLTKNSAHSIELREELIVRGHFFTISERRNRKSFSTECLSIYLRSVISSDGSDCYRKIGDNQWYRVNLRSSVRVDREMVLSCDSSMLFYEFEVLDEEINDADHDDSDGTQCNNDTTLLSNDMGTCLNRIIQSLAACNKFANWLNITSDNVDLIETRTLCSLINVVNNNVDDNNDPDETILQDWNDNTDSDVYELMTNILSTVVTEGEQSSSSSIGGHLATARKGHHHPMVIYHCCTSPRHHSSSSKLIIDLVVSSSLFKHGEPTTLQSLLDHYLQIWSGYDELHLKTCDDSQILSLNEGLPETICFHFDEISLAGGNGLIVEVAGSSIVVKNKSCVDARLCLSDYNACCRRYKLRSFIDKHGFVCRMSSTGIVHKLMGGKYCKVEQEMEEEGEDSSRWNVKMALYE